MPATDIERLVVQLSADFRRLDSSLSRGRSNADRQFRSIEARAGQLDNRLAGIGKNVFKGLAAPLAGIAAALSAREVLAYADAWTNAKNSLAVSGVVGEKQVVVLDALFKSAQRNATPIGALTALYGKAAQASDNLGASQEDLIKFSDGIAVALRVSGASADQASGALTQLGQLLGSARVQAEEFNSVNEGARPILTAVAKGLDAAGGSVNKLKQLVNAGQVSGKEFFNAFLKGLPAIQAMAANSTETIAQGLTKVNNAMVKYVGQTDSSLGASRQLVEGLNSLADHFDETADYVLKLAAVIAGALVGRSIVVMVAKLGLAGAALVNFIKLLRGAQAAAAFTSLASAAGPIGAIIGVAATAVTLFASSSNKASDSAHAYANSLRDVESAAKGAAAGVDKARESQSFLEKDQNARSAEILGKELDAAKESADNLFSAFSEKEPMSLITDEQYKQIRKLRAELKKGEISADDAMQQLAKLSTEDYNFREVSDQFQPILDALKAVQEQYDAVIKRKKELAEPVNLTDKLTHPSGDTIVTDKKKRDDFLNQRNADAMKTDLEKNVETRSKAIIDAAAKVGLALTEAAAKIQARSELATEAGVQATSASASSAAELLKKFESFRSSPYQDVNHLRVGYGSDTVTLDDGSIKEVTSGITVSVADATRDLVRRVAEEQAGIRSKIGADTFNGMTDDQQSALTSVAYNYGSLPERIVQAIKTGDAGTVAQAIKGLGDDNGGINKDRREKESDLYLSGASPDIQKRVQSTDDFAQQMKEQQQQIAALKEETGIRASLNPLISDYGQKLSEIEKAQELFKMSQQESTAAGKEPSSAQQLLNGDLSKLSPAARDQALAMRALAIEYGTTSAASEQLKASQDQLAQSAKDSVQLQKDVVGGALTDIRSALEDGKITAKEWGDIFVGVLNKVADKMQDVLVNSLFDKGGGLGGLFSLFTGGGSAFNPVGKVGLFDKGGYTGPGAKNKAAGIVHAGEYVFSQEAVKRIGLDNLRRMQGYANGGLVGMPSLPSLSGMGSRGGGNDSSHVVISIDDDGKVAAYVQKQGRLTEVRVLGKSKAVLDNYRANKFHDDVENHLGRRRVKGRPA